MRSRTARVHPMGRDTRPCRAMVPGARGIAPAPAPVRAIRPDRLLMHPARGINQVLFIRVPVVPIRGVRVAAVVGIPRGDQMDRILTQTPRTKIRTRRTPVRLTKIPMRRQGRRRLGLQGPRRNRLRGPIIPMRPRLRGRLLGRRRTRRRIQILLRVRRLRPRLVRCRLLIRRRIQTQLRCRHRTPQRPRPRLPLRGSRVLWCTRVRCTRTSP
jgi:hypothetical protein